jgi:hypothetical protein
MHRYANRKFLVTLMMIVIAISLSGCDFNPDISTIEAPATMGPQPFSTFQVKPTIIGITGTTVPNLTSMPVSGYEVKYEPELWNCP